MSSDWNAYKSVLTDLREKKSDIERAIAAIEALMPKGGVTMTFGPKAREASPAAKDERAGVPPTIIGGAMAFLQAVDKPVHVSEIVKELTAKGVKMESGDVANTVGSILNRRLRTKGDVVRVGRGTWALASHPLWLPIKEDADDDEGPSEIEPNPPWRDDLGMD